MELRLMSVGRQTFGWRSIQSKRAFGKEMSRETKSEHGIWLARRKQKTPGTFSPASFQLQPFSLTLSEKQRYGQVNPVGGVYGLGEVVPASIVSNAHPAALAADPAASAAEVADAA
jgi:hypothetical protein